MDRSGVTATDKREETASIGEKGGMRIRGLFVVSLPLLVTNSCVPARTVSATSGGSAATSYPTLVAHLRASGLEVESAGEVELRDVGSR